MKPNDAGPDGLSAAEIRHHWQDEADAAYLYRKMAAAESDPKRRTLYERLAVVEDRHVKIWTNLLEKLGAPPGPHRPGLVTRLRALLGKTFGPNALLPLLLQEEAREVKGYLAVHRGMQEGAAGKAESLRLARESAEHARTLAGLGGDKSAEPWHRVRSGGLLRNVVYGFNDGLTANFGLVAGMIGATASEGHAAVIVAGMAGLIADALSMGSSGYLAAKSEQEVYQNEIAMERAEIALMPELERDELALLYEAKGIPEAVARELAGNIMADPEKMLEEKAREELGIGEPHMSPLKEGWITGTATGVGALIPVFPFFFWTGTAAIALSFVLSMLSHFLVGAGRSVFTGRGLIRSGLDMFVVGLGVAAAGYFVGEWVSGLL